MMASQTARIAYLTRKVQSGTANQAEQNELAILVGHDPSEFAGPDGTTILLAIALAAVAAGIVIALLMSRR